MTLNEVFANALKESSVNQIELSRIYITQNRLEELLKGAEYTQAEELHMLRFIFKHSKKMYPNIIAGTPDVSKN